MRIPTEQGIRDTLARSNDRSEVHAEGYHRAAVLVPLVKAPGGFELLFTKRTDTVETHKGQVSFPGGMADADDRGIIATALRELEEEVGIDSNRVEILGLLDDMQTPTGFIVTPIVGLLQGLPPLAPNRDEVAEVFTVPLGFFLNPSTARSEYREHKGRVYEVWYYEATPHVIWGVTAAIIRALLKRLDLL